MNEKFKKTCGECETLVSFTKKEIKEEVYIKTAKDGAMTTCVEEETFFSYKAYEITPAYGIWSEKRKKRFFVCPVCGEKIVLTDKCIQKYDFKVRKETKKRIC